MNQDKGNKDSSLNLTWQQMQQELDNWNERTTDREEMFLNPPVISSKTSNAAKTILKSLLSICQKNNANWKEWRMKNF